GEAAAGLRTAGHDGLRGWRGNSAQFAKLEYRSGPGRGASGFSGLLRRAARGCASFEVAQVSGVKLAKLEPITGKPVAPKQREVSQVSHYLRNLAVTPEVGR